MPTWAVAIVATVIGSAAAWAFAVSDRFLRARREVAENDRAVAEHDEDLASWVSDRHLDLRRRLAKITEHMNEGDRNLFYSSTHAYVLALAKEDALHRYRDELRRVEREIAARAEAEGRFHRFWRTHRGGHPFVPLTAPERVEPILDAWRDAVTRHTGPPQEVVDPTRRDLSDALADVREHGHTGYGRSDAGCAAATMRPGGRAGLGKNPPPANRASTCIEASGAENLRPCRRRRTRRRSARRLPLSSFIAGTKSRNLTRLR